MNLDRERLGRNAGWPGVVCLAVAFALLCLGSGCARRYALTLNNGDVVMAASKPRLDERGYYVFKLPSGEEMKINSLRVLEIAVQ